MNKFEYFIQVFHLRFYNINLQLASLRFWLIEAANSINTM